MGILYRPQHIMSLQHITAQHRIAVRHAWHRASSLLRLALAVAGVLCLLGATPQEDQGQPITGEVQQAFLDTWSRRMRALRTLHMVFTQEKQLQFLRQPLSTQGELWLKGSTVHYRLHNLAGETEQELHMDHTTLRIYYPQLQTLEVIELQNAPSSSLPLPFLNPDPLVLSRDYEIALFATATGHTLRLRPKAPASPLQELCLMLKDFAPQAFLRLEKNGTRVLMKIATFTVNAPLPDTALTLVIPPGTTVTYPLR